MKRRLKKLLQFLWNLRRRRIAQRFYRIKSLKYLQKNNISNEYVDGEDAYIAFWSRFPEKIETESYRFFSRYMGKVPHIVPEYIGEMYLERYLNPVRYRDFYSDKNLYSQYMPHINTPKTTLRRIDGGQLLNENFDFFLNKGFSCSCEDFESYLKKYQDLIFKPSVDTDSGVGVVKFFRKENGFFNSNNEKLSLQYLMSSNDFILQEAVQQHPFFSKLCDTSVNTMRLCLYRSVKTEQIHLTGGIVRIGRKGTFVDNAHAGGRFVGINVSDGTLMKTTLDQYGCKTDVWNDIDYSHEKLKIPCWEKIRKFALDVALQNRHCRLIALDISLDVNENPVLIEENIGGFAYWLLEMTGQDPFGGFTNEVVEYCLKKMSEK